MRRTGGLRVIAVAVACTLLGTLCAPATLAHDFAWSRVDLRLEPEILHLEMYFDAESLGDATGVPLPIRRLEEIPKPELITAYIASHVSVSRGNAGCPLVFSEARIDRTLGKVRVAARSSCSTAKTMTFRSELFAGENEAHQLIASVRSGSRFGRYLFEGAVGDLSIVEADLVDLGGDKPLPPVQSLSAKRPTTPPVDAAEAARSGGTRSTDDNVLLRLGNGPNALRFGARGLTLMVLTSLLLLAASRFVIGLARKRQAPPSH